MLQPTRIIAASEPWSKWDGLVPGLHLASVVGVIILTSAYLYHRNSGTRGRDFTTNKESKKDAGQITFGPPSPRYRRGTRLHATSNRLYIPLLFTRIMADTDTQQPKIIAVSAVMLFLSTTSVALRLLARSKSGVGFWWDDWCAIFATV